MKKALAILLSLTLLLALAACGVGGGTGSTKAGDASAAATAATAATSTPAPAPDPTPEPTPEPSPSPAPDTPAGAYKLIGNGAGGEEDEGYAAMTAMGITYYLFLEEDGSGIMNLLGMEIPLRWDDGTVTISPVGDGEDETPAVLNYTYADGTMTIDDGENRMVFVKMTDEELENYQKNGPGSLENLFGEWLMNEPEPIPAGEPSEGPVSGTVNGMEVTILSAEQAKGDEGENVIRFYYEVTNTTDASVAPWSALETDAAQDGEALEHAWSAESVPEDDYSSLRIAPGKTIRCTSMFAFNPEGGTVGFRVNSYNDENSVLYYTLPGQLTDAPAEAFVFSVDPALPELSVPSESKDVSIDRFEFIKDAEGGDAVRFFFTFHNNTDKETSFIMDHSCYVMQDGYELSGAWLEESVPEEDNTWTDIAAGASIPCAAVFSLRSGSPVVLYIVEDWGDGVIAQVAEAG